MAYVIRLRELLMSRDTCLDSGAGQDLITIVESVRYYIFSTVTDAPPSLPLMALRREGEMD